MSGDRVIRALLRLYPGEFRERYGRAMLAFHRERVGEGRVVWHRVVIDHVASAVAEHVRLLGQHRRAESGGGSASLVQQDLHFALRSVVRRPLFATIVIATIALGVGANAAIFSVVNGVLLRALPYPDPDRLVSFGQTPPTWLLSVPELRDYRRELSSFESIAAYASSEGNLATPDEPERIAIAAVTPDFFPTIGMRPLLGRTFAPDDDAVTPATVVVLSYGLWQRRFGGDPRIVGETVPFNGRPRTVIGIMPRSFDFPSSHTDLWLPMPRFPADSIADRTNHSLFGVGRIRRGVRLERAVAEARTVARRMVVDHAESYDPTTPPMPVIERVSDGLVRQARPYLWTVFGAVGFVLLIACANVANLLLARGEGRRKEMAVRTALGASRRRLLVQLLTESTVFALAGGTLGVVLAWSGTRALVALAPASLPRVEQIGLDWVVLVYALGTSVIAGLLFGLVPAVRASREAPADTLRAGTRASHHVTSRRMRRALVVAEVGLAVMMLCGAGMLLRSLVNLQRADMGFEPRSVLTVKVSPSAATYNEARLVSFYAQLLDRVRAIPGVASAGAARWLPVVDAGGLWGVLAEGTSYDRLPKGPTAVPQQVTTGYFKAMGMPIVAGRDFSGDDRPGGPYVAIVSKALARELWGDADPLGKRFRMGGGSTFMTVVGVVSDIRSRGFDDTPEPTMYIPYPQTRETAYTMPASMSLVVRTAGDPLAVARQVKAIVSSLDATVPVSSVRTLEQVVGTSVANRRFSTALLGAFAALALVLAAVGIYGVISYGVSERRFEIGVRMALGAERGAVLAAVLGDGVRMATAGVALGLVGSVGIARVLRSMLVGVPAVDVVTFGVVALGLVVVAAVASLLPARRATEVSAMEALRGG